MYKDNDLFVSRDKAVENPNDEFLRQLLGDRDRASDGDSGCCDGGCGKEQLMRRNSGIAEPRGEDNDCHSWGLEGYPVAMVYSPLQRWRNIYDNDTALARGTIFEELDLPFVGGRCGCDKSGCNMTTDKNQNGKCGGSGND